MNKVSESDIRALLNSYSMNRQRLIDEAKSYSRFSVSYESALARADALEIVISDLCQLYDIDENSIRFPYKKSFAC